MKAHLLNAACGVLDYIAYPVGMLLLAPIILRHRGPSEFGVWAVAMAVVSTGAILASGFGDAGIQIIAAARARHDLQSIRVTVRAMMSLHVLLGSCLAITSVLLASVGAQYLSIGPTPQIRSLALASLHCASALMLLRAIEAVCVSVQRAFDCYGAALGISVSGRLLSLLVAGILGLIGRPIAQLLLGTLIVQLLSVPLQVGAAARKIGWHAFVPSFAWDDLCAIVRDGRYTWLIAAAGVLFAYADRLLLGFAQGAGSVAAYALCVQMAQPIYGIVANGLHFLFPYFARMTETVGDAEFRRILRKAVMANAGLAAGLSAVAGAIGWPLLRIFAGGAFEIDGSVFALVIASFGLLSASVVGTYALIATRRARDVAVAFGAGAAAMLVLMPLMLAHWGTTGLAGARLFFGVNCMLLYFPLLRTMRSPRSDADSNSLARIWAEDIKGDLS